MKRITELVQLVIDFVIEIPMRIEKINKIHQAKVALLDLEHKNILNPDLKVESAELKWLIKVMEECPARILIAEIKNLKNDISYVDFIHKLELHSKKHMKMGSKDNEVDCKNLLRKYMEQVISCEGVSFIPSKAGKRMYDQPIFTQEEVNYLEEIHEDIFRDIE